MKVSHRLLDITKCNSGKRLKLNKGAAPIGREFDLLKLYQHEYSARMVIIIHACGISKRQEGNSSEARKCKTAIALMSFNYQYFVITWRGHDSNPFFNPGYFSNRNAKHSVNYNCSLMVSHLPWTKPKSICKCPRITEKCITHHKS